MDESNMNQQLESCDENESNDTWETVDSDCFVLDDNDKSIPAWNNGKFINDDGCMM